MNLKPYGIILFIKAPIQGQTKTRLADKIGCFHAVNIYKCFIKDIVRTATRTGFNIKIFYHPPGTKELIQGCMGKEFDYHVQSGPDLGIKMANAFRTVFKENFHRAILIGSDIPDLPETHIAQAMRELDGHDAVIGPTHDGGYYLIGFRSDSFTPEIFTNLVWSSDTVYENTCTKFEESGLSVYQLPPWRDIDIIDDLMDLSESLSNLRSFADESKKYLNELDMSATHKESQV